MSALRCSRSSRVSPRLLIGAGRDHHDGRAGAVVVVACPDARRMSEGDGVVQVHRLALGLSVVVVDEYDLGREAA